MDAEFYNRLRAKWVREEEDAQALVIRLRAQIRDLDQEWKKCGAGTALANSRPSAQSDSTPFRAGNSFVMRVSESLATLPQEFASPDVWASFLALNPTVQDTSTFRANVSGALANLVKAGVIELIERGAGKRPSTFRKAASAVNGGESATGS